MQRTQIYITEHQANQIRDIAADRRVSKAEVIRSILDAALDGDGSDTEADSAISATAGMCADYPDWPEWQAAVRGRSTSARLRDLDC